MDSTDVLRVQRRLRVRYEWSRARRALVGVAPAAVLAGVAASASDRPGSVLALGASLFAACAVLLWYGGGAGKAVLPGLLAGVAPLALALCANQFGSVCAGGGCVALCMPACTVGGVTAGLAVAAVARRRGYGPGFWITASGLALATGAMGCSCIGKSGLFGLASGYAVGLIPQLFRMLYRRREC